VEEGAKRRGDVHRLPIPGLLGEAICDRPESCRMVTEAAMAAGDLEGLCGPPTVSRQAFQGTTPSVLEKIDVDGTGSGTSVPPEGGRTPLPRAAIARMTGAATLSSPGTGRNGLPSVTTRRTHSGTSRAIRLA